MIIDNIENKRKILAKFLEISAFEGVNEEILEKSMVQCGIEAKFKSLIFENGVLSLIEFYIEEIVEKLAISIKNQVEFAEFKIREKIKFALYEIFEQQKDNKLALQRFRNFYFDLKNFQDKNYGARPILLAVKNSFKIADQIWFLIGDKSTDYNFYTKRLILAKIISRSFLVFLKDETNELEKTKSFIDAQIENVMKFEKFKAKVKSFSCNSQDKICEAKEKLGEFFVDEDGKTKSVKEIVKNLPFIRLFY